VYAQQIAEDFWAIVGSLVISVTVSTVLVGWLMQRLIRRRPQDTRVQP
jgi:holin-like protein